MANPLLDDRGLAFVLHDVLDAGSLARLPHFADHGRETFDAWIDLCRRFARDVLYPSYRPLDAEPPVLRDGAVRVHPAMREIWPRLCGLGVIAAARPFEAGGQQLPATIALAANLYLMAGNLSAYGFAGLTSGAAHLLEAFGSAALRQRWLAPMHEGRFAGTMALTEPQAGSSLADVRTRATPAGDHFLLSGSKIFISGGDQDLTENVVHMVLARVDGAPPGTKGVSLFLVPKLRPTGGGGLEPNDVRVPGLIHKIGWRGIPSVILSLGEAGDCRGWLLGEPGRGLPHMFQMMNEARIMVGGNGVATASVAYLESPGLRPGAPPGAPPRRPRPALAAGPHRRARRRPAHAAPAEGHRGGGARAGAPCRAPVRPGRPRRHAGGEAPRPAAPRPAHAGGQVVPGREGVRVQRAGGPDSRRVWVLERVPGRGLAARPEAQLHPRGDERHPGNGPPGAEGHGRGGRGARHPG